MNRTHLATRSLRAAVAVALAFATSATAQAQPVPPPQPQPGAAQPPPEVPPPEPPLPDPPPTEPVPITPPPEPPPPPPPQQPPPQYPPPMMWAPPPPPPGQEPKPLDGTSETGVPYSQRGKIAFDTAACLNTDGNECGAFAALDVAMPVTDHLFIDAYVPISFFVGSVGNPGLGAHYVGRVLKQLWLTGGGEIGIPLISNDDFIVSAIPKALWDSHYWFFDQVPITLRFGLEWHASIVELRVQLEPSLWAPVPDSNIDVGGAFYHAVEVQLGHKIGGGLRLQGVMNGPLDLYQAALQLFFAVEHDIAYLRTGPMMPLHEDLGPPFEESWGFLLEAGMRLD